MTLAKNRRLTRLLASLLLASLLAALVAPLGTTVAEAQPQTAPDRAMAASSVHEVPFGADGNALRLTVANATGAKAPAVEVVLVEAPAWIEGMPAQTVLGALGEKAEAAARLPFDVARAAPVGEVATLRFSIRSAGTVIAEKQVRLQVAPPTAMRLRGNYPNPFAGQTTVGYELPQAAEVRLEVHDVLGWRVNVLDGGLQQAGFRELRWPARGQASGVYLYRLVADLEQGDRLVRHGRMTLVR